MPFLELRQLEPEIMDDPSLGEVEHTRALSALARVHWLTGTTNRLWAKLLPLLKQQSRQEPLRVMDVGCGDGFVLRQLTMRARSAGYHLLPIGCDFSERALAMAVKGAEGDNLSLELHCVDVTRQVLPVVADVVFCSLFLHHFREQEVVEILKKFSTAARHLILVEDLLRSPLGYYVCWIGVHLLTRSRVVHVDGLLSVRAAFTMAEMGNILKQAGVRNGKLHKHWPERLFIEWKPDIQG